MLIRWCWRAVVVVLVLPAPPGGAGVRQALSGSWPGPVGQPRAARGTVGAAVPSTSSRDVLEVLTVGQDPRGLQGVRVRL